MLEKTMAIGQERWRPAPFADAIVDLGRKRPDVVVLSADLAKYTDTLSFSREYPDRFVQVGMAEQNLMGVAGGLAKTGFLPVAVSFGAFATRRAYDQVAMSLATGPSRAIVVGFLPGITSRFEATHQAVDDLALMRAIPKTTVIDPVDATELAAALHAGAEYDGLVYLRAQRGNVVELFEPDGFEFRIGATRTLLDGGDVGLIGTGLGTYWAMEANERLKDRGIAASLLHVPTLHPVDVAGLKEYLERFSTVVTVENHSVTGGLGSVVAGVVASEGIPVRVRYAGVPGDSWGVTGTHEHARRSLRLDSDSIADAVVEALRVEEGR